MTAQRAVRLGGVLPFEDDGEPRLFYDLRLRITDVELDVLIRGDIPLSIDAALLSASMLGQLLGMRRRLRSTARENTQWDRETRAQVKASSKHSHGGGISPQGAA